MTVYATDATLNTRNLRVADIAKAEAKAKAIVAGLGQLCDSTRENVHIVIANRYLELCAIHNRYDNRNDSIRALKLPKQKEANALSGLTITIIMIFIAPGSILSLGLIFTLRMLR